MSWRKTGKTEEAKRRRVPELTEEKVEMNNIEKKKEEEERMSSRRSRR